MRNRAIIEATRCMDEHIGAAGEYAIDIDEKYMLIIDFKTSENLEYFSGTYDLPPYYTGEIVATPIKAMLLEFDILGVVRNSEDITADIPTHFVRV